MYNVLIIDDEYYVREMLKKCICWEDFGFTIVAEASSGAQAVKLAREIPISLILLDINLLDMSGFEALEEIYKAEPAAKTIVITGYDMFEYTKKAIYYHVYDYLLKPILPVELENTLRNLRRDLDSEAQMNSRVQELTDNIRELLSFKDLNSSRSAREDAAPESEAYPKTVVLAMNYVAENISDPELSVKKISNELFVNMSYLSSLFKKTTGYGLHEYIIKMRMEKAYDLIIKSNASAAEIARQVGFTDPIYFCRNIKEYYNCSFQEIRRIKQKYIK